MKYTLYFIFFYFFQNGCNTSKIVLLDKYDNFEFDNFVGWTIFKPLISGFGREKPVYFLLEKNNTSDIRYVIELNDKKDRVIDIKKQFIRDTISTDGVIFNRDKLEIMTLEFSKLNIYSLTVDFNLDVYIQKYANVNSKLLARFSKPENIDLSKWEKLRENWYKQK